MAVMSAARSTWAARTTGAAWTTCPSKRRGRAGSIGAGGAACSAGTIGESILEYALQLGGLI
jgi:hypothetical protein